MRKKVIGFCQLGMKDFFLHFFCFILVLSKSEIKLIVIPYGCEMLNEIYGKANLKNN